MNDMVRHDVDNFGVSRPRVTARASFPSQHGVFEVYAFAGLTDGGEHIAIVRGNPVGATRVSTRVHSRCATGDALGSLRCDCREQLELALADLGSRETGVLLYMDQEGRGIGLVNKIRAYALQDEGVDTVDANHMLGFADDERSYGAAAEMLRCLRVRSVSLMTNNPDKVAQLAAYGVDVVRSAHEVIPNRFNARYLSTKRRRSGHMLTLAEDAR